MKRKWWKECVVYQIYPRSFFWLRRGVDGFRLDALDMLLEIPICPTTRPIRTTKRAWRWTPSSFTSTRAAKNGIHELIAGIRRVCDEFGGRDGTHQRPELHLPLNPSFLFQPSQRSPTAFKRRSSAARRSWFTAVSFPAGGSW
jgi:hypothetical protein